MIDLGIQHDFVFDPCVNSVYNTKIWRKSGSGREQQYKNESANYNDIEWLIDMLKSKQEHCPFVAIFLFAAFTTLFHTGIITQYYT